MTFSVTNWASYEAGTAAAWYLEAVRQQRCDTAWRAAACTTPGRQARYSAVAIEVALIFRLVFYQLLRYRAIA
jgi:hypothetical protein